MRNANKILKRDFDAAVKRPWNATTCLVAQYMRRVGIPISSKLAPYLFATQHGVRDVQRTFDIAHPERGKALDRGAKQELAKLRASLPITIKGAK